MTATPRDQGEPRALRVLHLEDRPEDIELLHAALEQDGIACEVEVVSTRADFVAALERGPFDLVLSDFALPGFDGLTALEIKSKLAPGTPFILVSGTIGEESAIESLRGGATDYVLKHRLSRLGPAVKRALREAEERRTREQAEAALHREQHFLRVLLDCLETGIVACEADGTVRLFNRAARAMHGLPDDRLSADERARHYALLGGDGKTPIDRADLPLFRALRGESVREAELVIRPAGAPARTVLVSGQPIVDERGQCLGAVVAQHDISERKRLENQLNHARKMEAVGRLAGGVAHDFNNLLTVMLGYGELLRDRLGAGQPGREDVEEIVRAAERGAGLTRQLLAFSRQQVLEPRVLDLNAVVASLDKLLHRLIGEDVALVTVPAPGLGHVMADPGQIEQVLMNLVVNARHAMPDGGRIRIETANVDAAEEPGVAGPRRSVVLSVIDTGHGMSADVMDHIFEPFFTTKGLGQGTGLGLSTVHGIVVQSGGHVEVESRVGVGTTFRIVLPRVEDSSEAPPTRTTRGEHRGSERILLVEDEESIRRVLRHTLEQFGYDLVEAGSGEEAIAVAEREGPIDLLVTDVVMPLMSGPLLVRHLRERRPDLPVLFISGYIDRALAEEGVQGPATAFLQKPFKPEALARKVRDLLGERTRRAA